MSIDNEQHRAGFEAWWEAHGQFCRAGGGDYEKTFAYAAWMHHAQPAAQGERAAPSESRGNAVHQILSWLRAQANAEQDPGKRAAFIEAHNAALSLATPAPTAGESSARPDGACNSALHAEPAGQHDAAIAVLSAVRDGITLQEPVSVTKAVLAQREARVVLDGGKGPVACVMLVNIQLTGWAEGPEKAEAFANGYNTAFKWYRGALLDLANKVSANAATRSRVEGGMHENQDGESKDLCATQGRKEGKP